MDGIAEESRKLRGPIDTFFQALPGARSSVPPVTDASSARRDRSKSRRQLPPAAVHTRSFPLETRVNACQLYGSFLLHADCVRFCSKPKTCTKT